MLGIGLFLGKLSWGLAVAADIGIGMIFGAAQIVTWIGAGVLLVLGRLLPVYVHEPIVKLNILFICVDIG